jgi:peptidoglycan/xylan/chitin deacetylase (PgdA/CDA1 family)
MHANRFDQLLGHLKRSWRVLPLRTAVELLTAGDLKSRSLAITFDDGYADNAQVAWPLLQKHDCPATIFVSTGHLDGGRMWNDTLIEAVRHSRRDFLQFPWMPDPMYTRTLAEKRQLIDSLIAKVKHRPFAEREQMCRDVAAACGATLPTDLMMTRKQLLALRGSCIDFGAHTIRHPILANLPDAEAEFEIRHGKVELEAMLGQPVQLFAYPNGKPSEDYLPKHVDMVRAAGFEAAVSTYWGACNRNSDPFQLPRFSPWDQDARKFEFRLLKNLFA